jgi:hypothetical protein
MERQKTFVRYGEAFKLKIVSSVPLDVTTVQHGNENKKNLIFDLREAVTDVEDYSGQH